MFLVPLDNGDLPHPEDWAMTPWMDAAKNRKKRDTDNIAHNVPKVMRCGDEEKKWRVMSGFILHCP